MNKLTKLTLIIVAFGTLSGCVSSIGEENFTCDAQEKGGVCAGPRDIYELTNNRVNLENLSLDDLHSQVHGEVHHDHSAHTNSGKRDKSGVSSDSIYVPRSNEQHTEHNYQRAELVPPIDQVETRKSDFQQWPHNGAPLAPEAMAMLEEPKPMRILVSSFTDSQGVFHIPGYVYVNTQASTWIKGSATDLRPTRVVPLELRRQSVERNNRANQRRTGVDGLGVTIGQGQ